MGLAASHEGFSLLHCTSSEGKQRRGHAQESWPLRTQLREGGAKDGWLLGWQSLLRRPGLCCVGPEVQGRRGPVRVQPGPDGVACAAGEGCAVLWLVPVRSRPAQGPWACCLLACQQPDGLPRWS